MNILREKRHIILPKKARCPENKCDSVEEETLESKTSVWSGVLRDKV